MVDNVAVTPGSGSTIATDDVGGVHFQRVKVTWGADGTANDANATTPLPVSVTPYTSGGYSVGTRVTATGYNATALKGSAGQLYGWAMFNKAASPRYVKFYNQTAAPSVTDNTPVMTIMVPGNAAGVGTNIEIGGGIAFGTGIAYATTAGMSVNDTASISASDLVLNIWYK
jgi:hypothetical protein